MNREKPISRREFLAYAVAASAALLVPAQLPAGERLRQAQAALLASRLSALLAHQASARVIGQEYARLHPEEADIARLVAAIVEQVPGGALALLVAPERELRAQLDRATRADFAAERVVKLRGWLLSATEARLCALAALT
jgi:hypothetical protein